MKTTVVLCIGLVTLLIGQPVFGQGGKREIAICGVEFEQLPCNLLRYPYVNALSLPQVNIGVAVHVVRYDDGTGGYGGDLQAIVSNLNQKFAGSNMWFVLDHVRFINSSYFAVIEEHNRAKEDELALEYNFPGVINVYFVPVCYANGIGTFTPDIAAAIGRYQQSIIILNDAAETSTVPHEFGHYFNLLHTFERACGDDRPVQGLCAQGENGNTMGDLINTTPPDPWPGEYWNGCTFTGGTEYCPSPYNLMSYAYTCRNQFTQLQMDRARTTYEQKRPELHGGFLVEIDQQLQDGRTIGVVKRWLRNQFHPLPSLPWRVVTRVGNTEVLQGQQDLISLQKYNRWNDFSDVRNHRGFQIHQGLNLLTSNFIPSHEGVQIRTELIDAPGTTGGSIQFRDPWYIDYPDSLYGNNWRNRGMQHAEYRTRSLVGQFAQGWKPDTTTIYPEDGPYPYRGVFLNQEIAPGLPYYSVGAPSPQQIGGYTSHFLNWAGHPDSVGYQNAAAQQTGVVFKHSGARAVARYKAHLASSLPTATSTNSQRKLAADFGYLDTKIALCYTSGGEVWLSESNGWELPFSAEERVSDGSGGFGFPSVVAFGRSDEQAGETDNSATLSQAAIVYQRNAGGVMSVYFREKRGGQWFAPMQLASYTTWYKDATPVIGPSPLTSNNPEW